MSRGEVHVPANLDLPDRILFNLTARQVVVLVPVGAGLFGLWRGLMDVVPIPMLLMLSAPIAAIAFALAVGRKDGASLDRLALAAIKQPRRPVAAGGPSRQVRGFLTGFKKRSHSLVSTTKAAVGPVRDLSDEGVIDLGRAGYAVATDVGFVNFGLRSFQERDVLVAVFARLLRSIDAHVQVTVSTRPVNLDDHLAALEARCQALCQGPLLLAARAHHAWLADLMRRQNLLRRDITVIVTTRDVEGAQWAGRQVASTAGAIGISAKRLSGPELATRIRYRLDPITTTPTDMVEEARP